MRTPGKYSPPKYSDPNDLRLVQMVRPAEARVPNALNILGIPFDGAVLGRKGAAEGPSGIRRALSGFSNYNLELKIGTEGSEVFDLGDLSVYDDDVLKTHSGIEDEVGRDISDDSLLVILGGDNSVSLPAIRAYAKKFDEIGLVVIDSHLDLRGKIEGKPTSGSSYGLAMEEVGGLDPRRVVEVGIHGFLNSKKYADKAGRLGVSVFTASDVRKEGPAEVARMAYKTASKGARAVYLSVDLDAVDLSYVSGVSAPSVGGISAQELCEVAYSIAKERKVKCADLVETAPSLDPTGRSPVVAATALVYMLAGFRKRYSGASNSK